MTGRHTPRPNPLADLMVRAFCRPAYLAFFSASSRFDSLGRQR